MVTLFVKHAVQDFDQWKNVYDGLGPVRQRMGVTGAGVWRDAQDANLVTITHQFRDLNAATSFAQSDELRSAMANAGVAGAPEVWFGQDVETTPY